MTSCPRCDGTGFEVVEEDGQRVEFACYHCANTGQIDEAQAEADRLETLAGAIGQRMASDEKKAANSDPEGDGYSLCAAECGVSESDYFAGRRWVFASKAQAELAKLDKEVLRALLDLGAK